MLVKVRYHDIIHMTDKAVKLLISENEIWMPKCAVKWMSGNYIAISKNMADEKEIKKYSLLYHKPKKIDPVFNQSPIGELKHDVIQ